MSADLSGLMQDCTRPSPHMREHLERILARPDRPARWMPRRLILQNFWVFRYQEFHFVDGRLNIKGANQTGKTVVMTSALPLVLDGVARPERLDPQGSRARGLEYYLLGGSNVGPAFEYDDRTAYIALEFEHGETGHHTTIGVAFRASKSRSRTDFWGFVLRDGRRIGPDHEIELRTKGRERLPLSRAQLAEILAEDPANVLVHDDREEYQRAVNNALFGFDDLEQFRFMMALLLQLRSPKLSNDAKLDDVIRALRESLPPLDEDLLAQVSNTVSRINKTKGIVQKTARELALVREIDDLFGAYLHQLAQGEAVNVLDSRHRLDGARAELERLRAEVARETERAETLSVEIADLERGILAATEERAVIESNEAYRSHDDLARAEEDLAERHRAAEGAWRSLTQAREALQRVERRLEDLTREWTDAVGAVRATLDEALEVARRAAWPVAEDAVRAALAALDRARIDNGEDVSASLAPGLIADRGEERRKKLSRVLDATGRRAEAERKHEAARAELDRLRKVRDQADAEVRSAERQLGEAKDGLGDQLFAWRDSARGFRASDAALERALEAVDGYVDPRADARGVLEAVEAESAERAREIGERIEDAVGARAELRKERADREAELKSWRETDWATPKARRGQTEARAALELVDIPAAPLYAVCEVVPGVPDGVAALVESALEDAGLLDALVVPAGRGADAARALSGPAADRWVRPSPCDAERTLADVLRPISSVIPDEDVLAVLRSVAISEDGVGTSTISPSGVWAIGLLAGRTARDADAPRYIGEENRVRQRDAAIRRLKAEIEDVDGRIAVVDEEIRAHRARLALIDADVKAARGLDGIAALTGAAASTRTARQALERAAREMEAADARLAAAHSALEAARVEVTQAVAAVPEAQGRNAEGVRHLQEATRDAIRLAQQAGRDAKGLDGVRQRRRDADGDLLHERGRAAQAEAAAEEAASAEAAQAARCEAIRSLLTDLGVDVDELLERVQEIGRRIKADRERVKELRDERAGAQKTAELRTEDAGREANAVERREAEHRAHVRALAGRLDAEPHPTLAAARERFRVGGPVAAADELLKLRKTEGEDLRRQVEDSRKRALGALAKKIQESIHALASYHPSLDEATDRVRLRHEGASLAPAELAAALQVIHEEHARILREDEEGLYAEFFLKELAIRIRDQIEIAHSSTERVNSLLATRRISENGETMEIEWRARPADHADPAAPDYERLVRLLGFADVRALPADEVRWVTEFFRGRIDEISARDEAGALETDFADALRRAFDYRDWFEFRLFTRMPGRPKNLLRQVSFGQRSGAGKALAIFLPLLTAAHVRMEAARPDAPKLVALDEAFAGVDSSNVGRMFDLLVSMDFSWVMTSEHLWGVAHTLPACTTYEMILRGNVSTPILYLWDGARRIGTLESALGGDPEPAMALARSGHAG